MGSRTSSTSPSPNPHRVSLHAIALSSVLILALSATAFARVNPRRIPPPRLGHVFIIVEENRASFQVVGNTTDWPYFNSEIPKGALVTNMFGVGHPSIDNYFALTAGRPVTHDDDFSRHHPGKLFKFKDVVDALNSAGVTWKVYAENLPSPATSEGLDPYEKHHDPFVYFNNVVNVPANLANVVDFSQLATDESNNTLPEYAFIIPNACDSGHGTGSGTSCSNQSPEQWSQDADTWLSNNVPGILNSSQMAQNGLLIITWDEGEGNDRKHGGGHIATLLLGPQVKAGYEQTTKNVYNHYATLHLMMQALDVGQFPGASRAAPWMGEFFTGAQM